MRFEVILNRDGGSLRTLDLDAFADQLASTLMDAGHQVNVAKVEAGKVDDALKAAVSGDCDVIMVGGGDGTVSSAASILKETDKALAILPAGTMNLFARSLGIPLVLDEAITALADGHIRSVDLATANDKVFVHQFSVGLHAKLIRVRERHTFNSRIGKIWASIRAAFTTFVNPPRLRVLLNIDGSDKRISTAGIGVSNNLFGEGHLPYTDTPDGGVLGVYVTRSRSLRDFARFALNLMWGRWQNNDEVDVTPAKNVTITMRRSDRLGCAMDGELYDLDTVTTIRIHPRALYVLVPRNAGNA